MQKEQLMISETMGIESRIRKQDVDSVEILRKKLHQRNKRLKDLKKETRNLISELDYAYKEMRRNQKELVIREKLSVAGGLAAGIAHEIKSSLNIISISVQHIHGKFTPGDERREFTKTIMDKVERLNNVATDLIQYARPHEPDFEKSNIHRILDQILSLVQFKCVVQKVNVVKEFAPDLPLVTIDKELIEEVFLNLIDNALWAMPEGGELIIVTRHQSRTNYIKIQITDTGCGISKSDCSRIFDPFFSRRKNGTGLGLSIVHRIIEEHRGFIRAESELSKGTTFLIKLPLSQRKQRI